MSGRVRWQRDGVTVVGHRKTDRRQGARRPLLDRLHELNRRAGSRVPGGVPHIRMAFLLPKTLQGFVATGPHGIGVCVLARGFVQVTSYSGERCFALARNFFAAIAKDRPGFTVTASIVNAADPQQSFGRHLSVARGVMVVSGGLIEPKIYETA